MQSQPPLDTYKIATPVIPALTRLWRIKCAFSLLPLFGSVFGLVTFFLLASSLFKFTGNFEYDFQRLFMQQSVFVFLNLVFILVFPPIAYYFLTVPLYRWLYSRGH